MYSPENLLQAKPPIFPEPGTKPQKFPKFRDCKMSFPLHFPKTEIWHKSMFGKLPKSKNCSTLIWVKTQNGDFGPFSGWLSSKKNGFGTVWFLGLGWNRADPARDLLGVGRNGADRACQDALYLWGVNFAGNKFSGEYMLFTTHPSSHYLGWKPTGIF